MTSLRHHDRDDHELRAERFNLSSKYQNRNMFSINNDVNQRSTINNTQKRRVIKRPQSSFDNVIIPPPPPSSKERRKSPNTRKKPSRSPSPPQSFSNRKSAIKDVMKQFQCNNDLVRMNTSVMCQPLRSSPRSSPLRERSSTLKQNQNGDVLDPEMLDNSLLDESIMDSMPYSFRYSKERSHSQRYNLSEKSSPLQKLFHRPLQACRTNFIHEPENMDMKASYGCNLFSNNENAHEDNEDFHDFSSNFPTEELNSVFRRPTRQNVNENVKATELDQSNEFYTDEKVMIDDHVHKFSFNDASQHIENNLTGAKSYKSTHESEHSRNFITPSIRKHYSKHIDPASANTAMTESSTPDSNDLSLFVSRIKTPEQLFKEELSAKDDRLERALIELGAKDNILKQISEEKKEIERKMKEMENQYRKSQQDKEDIEASFLLESFISEEETENQMKELTKLRKVNHQARLELNQEKKKKEELQNQVRVLQSEILQHRSHTNDLNKSHKALQQQYRQLDSRDDTKDTLSMKVDLVSLKSKLANVENLLSQEKEAREKDRNQFMKNETRLQSEIQKLMKSLAKGKTSAQYSALEAQLQIQKEDNDLLQERLAESEVYISTLEKTMDDQIKAWEEEEEVFKKESSTLREKVSRTVALEEALSSAKERIINLEQELLTSKSEIARFSSETGQQKESEINDSKETSKESVEHLLELANELRIENDELRAEVKRTNKSLEDTQMSTENQYKSEINRLKEELKHATFRVQIMKNSSSPKRKLKTEISDSLQESNMKDYQGEEKESTNVLCSEEQLHHPNEAEDATKKMIVCLQNEVNQLKAVNSSLGEEAAARKRIELALRDEISSLRQVKIESCSNSILPSVPKTHSNMIGGELQKLDNVISLLHELLDTVAKAQVKKNRNVPLVEKIFHYVVQLKTTYMSVLAASEEDKARVENAYQVYGGAVQSYELQLTELRKKLDTTKQVLNEQQALRADDLKRSKQAEFNILAKLSMLKQKFSSLEKEHEALKACSNLDRNDESVPDKSSMESSMTTQHNQWKMKIQHTASEDEIEIKLKEGKSFFSSFSDPNFSIERQPSSTVNSHEEKDLVIETRFLDTTESSVSKSFKSDMNDSGENSVLLSMDSTFEKDNPSDEYSKLFTLDNSIQSSVVRSIDDLDADSFVAEGGSMTQASF